MIKIALLVVGIIGILAVSIVLMTNDNSNKTSFSYDVEYDDLVTRNVYVSAQISTEEFPKKICYQISDNEFSDFPEGVKEVMVRANQTMVSPEELAQYDKDYLFFEDVSYFTGESSRIKPQDGLEFLKKYDSFKLTKNTTNQNIKKWEDSYYVFTCDVKYQDGQYRITIGFDPIYPSWENFVFVNITKNEWGLATIENPDITVYETFNATVVFQNNLDHDITLARQNSDIIDSNSPFDQIVIPKQKSWSHMFRTWILKGDEPYNYASIPFSYEIQPGNLIGKVIVNGYPRCMTVDEIKSLYGEVQVYPKFPNYLPHEYFFECGVHNTNSFVHFVYFTDELRLKFDDRVNAAFNREFFADGGLVIDYYDEFENGWIEDPTYDKFEKAKENAAYPQSITLTIAEQPAVLAKEYFWQDGKQQSFNRLEVFLDDAQIRIKSGLPQEELIKIAESLFES